uniref:Uncharacterized protein n=1 Tax=Chromera velia CCMP2878 TaxID=1169474 RepID=A0A0G4HSE2_9ALVE|eukprot:Cvel_8275.t1-p1 / transcript=Cvel_8275.t1 / gene=Cvel_8275 / organism=Chromera_velia_CCMP2878 / gene_product=Mycocerosic acid synthase, putative / transcript_product=Mycocerosic acid synthase, putative / location=Cvel_scaffold454:3091-24019(-) / protein_length=4523 / sequence_SO=supercontig / SO=protein_coding / is_pseudo=false
MAGMKRAALRCGIFRERVFHLFVKFIVARPVLTIISSLILVAALSSGMIFLRDETRIDQLYTPRVSRSLDDLETYATLFSDQSVRVETVILYPKDSDLRSGNGLLTESAFSRLFDLHETVLSIQTGGGDDFESLCFKYDGERCGVISALEVFGFNRTDMSSQLEKAREQMAQSNDTSLSAQSDVSLVVNTFGQNHSHITRLGRAPLFMYPIVFGGQKRAVVSSEDGGGKAEEEGENLLLLGANALMTQFVLRRSAPVVKDMDSLEKKTREWELEFDAQMRKLKASIERESDLTIAWQSERSLEDDSIESTDQDFALISITFSIMCTFACVKLSLNFKDEAGKHALLAFMGVFNVAFASFAAFGAGALLEIPFAPIVKVAPFLLLGIGVDDMFLMVNELDSLPADMEPKTRVITAIVKVAPTVALTSLTDLLAFCCGIFTVFPAISAFCSYMAIGVAFDWLLQMTFFVACMTLDAQRIYRDPSLCGYCPCLCKKRQQRKTNGNRNTQEEGGDPEAPPLPPEEADEENRDGEKTPNSTTVRALGDQTEGGGGGPVEARGGNEESSAVAKSPAEKSSWGVMRGYGRFITHPVSRVFIVIVYLLLLGGAAYLCTKLKEGLDLQLLSPQGSELPNYYAAFDTYWREGLYPELHPVGVEVRVAAWDPSVISAAREGTDLKEENGGTYPAKLYGQNPFLERFDVALENLRAEKLVLAEADGVNYVTVARETAEAMGKSEGLPLGTVLEGSPQNPAGRSFIVDMGFLKDSPIGNMQTAPLADRLKSIIDKRGPHAVKAHIAMDVGMQGRHASIGQKDAMLAIRKSLDKAKGPEFEAIAVALPFRYFEQYAIILQETLRNLAFALLGVVVACLLLTSSLPLAVTTALSVLSIDVMVLGMMSLWDIALDSISAVNLVMAIGLAADYVLHVALDVFQPPIDPAELRKMTGAERIRHALEHTGVSVLSGGITTFLGVLPTAWARSHVFNIFFKMFVGICGFALLHGLLITPVILSFFVGAKKKKSNVKETEVEGPPDVERDPAGGGGGGGGEGLPLASSKRRASTVETTASAAASAASVRPSSAQTGVLPSASGLDLPPGPSSRGHPAQVLEQASHAISRIASSVSTRGGPALGDSLGPTRMPSANILAEVIAAAAALPDYQEASVVQQTPSAVSLSLEPDDMHRALLQLRKSMSQPCIVGVSARFAKSPDKEGFWETLSKGVTTVSEYPSDRVAERYRFDQHFSKGAKERPMRAYVNKGAFCSDVDLFDNTFFAVTDQEARSMDPQHRLLLEGSFNAIQDAGVPLRTLQQHQRGCGVFVGIMNIDAWSAILRDNVRYFADQFFVTAGTKSIGSGRISFALDLTGPSMTFDTACSSSLVAASVACNYLEEGKIDNALVAGVNVLLDWKFWYIASKAGMMAPDGRCKTFDASADGYGRGEGCGVLLVKRTRDALADGDRIYAVVSGHATNNDGRNAVPITNPSAEMQEMLCKQVQRRGGFCADDIRYIECHGTGTPVGDLAEVTALSRAFGEGRTKGPIPVGGAKAVFNHTESAAGVASIIKVALMIHKASLVPIKSVQVPNPKLFFARDVLVVQDRLETDLQIESSDVFCINNFGYGGSSVHMALGPPPPPQRMPGPFNAQTPTSSPQPEDAPLPFVLSAHSKQALLGLCKAYLPWIKALTSSAENAQKQPAAKRAKTSSAAQEDPVRRQLLSLSSALCARASQFSWRLAIAAASGTELTQTLETISQVSKLDDIPKGVADSAVLSRAATAGGSVIKPVFVFGGQGSQWFGMGASLFQREALARSTFEEIDRLLQEDLKVPQTVFSLKAAIEHHLSGASASEKGRDTSAFFTTRGAQVGMYAVQVASFRCLAQWGVSPSAVIGHSLGEVAAAHCCGALSLADGLRVIWHRADLQASLCSNGQGAMAAADISEQQATELIREMGLESKLNVGAVNDLTSVTLSGDKDALSDLEVRLKRDQPDLFFRTLPVNCAFHSHQMDVIKDKYLQRTAALHPQPPSVPFFSTVDPRTDPSSTVLDCNYWWANIRGAVLFAGAFSRLLAEGYTHFVEVAAQPTLGRYMSNIARGVGIAEDSIKQVSCLPRQRGKGGVWLSPSADESRSLRLAGLMTWAWGLQWDLRQMLLSSPRQSGKTKITQAELPVDFLELPSWPWQRSSFWIHSNLEEANKKFAKGDQKSAAKAIDQNRILKEAHCISTISDIKKAAAFHPLLGHPAATPYGSGQVVFEQFIEPARTLAWLEDHRLSAAGGEPVFPATAYVECALAAAFHCGFKTASLEKVNFRQFLPIPKNELPRLRVALMFGLPHLNSQGDAAQRVGAEGDPQAVGFEICSSRNAGMELVLHAQGVLRLDMGGAPAFRLGFGFDARSLLGVDGATRLPPSIRRGGRKHSGTRKGLPAASLARARSQSFTTEDAENPNLVQQLREGGYPEGVCSVVSINEMDIVLRHHTLRLPALEPAGDGPVVPGAVEAVRRLSGVRVVERGEFFGLLEAAGFTYGPAFSLVDRAWVGRIDDGKTKGSATALQIRLPHRKREIGEFLSGNREATAAIDQLEDPRYLLPPSLMDACLQGVVLLMTDEDGEGEGKVPYAVRKVSVYRRIRTIDAWCVITPADPLAKGSNLEDTEFDIQLFDGEENLVATWEGFALAAAGAEAARAGDDTEILPTPQSVSPLCYKIAYKHQPLDKSAYPPVSGTPRILVVRAFDTPESIKFQQRVAEAYEGDPEMRKRSVRVEQASLFPSASQDKDLLSAVSGSSDLTAVWDDLLASRDFLPSSSVSVFGDTDKETSVRTVVFTGPFEIRESLNSRGLLTAEASEVAFRVCYEGVVSLLKVAVQRQKETEALLKETKKRIMQEEKSNPDSTASRWEMEERQRINGLHVVLLTNACQAVSLVSDKTEQSDTKTRKKSFEHNDTDPWGAMTWGVHRVFLQEHAMDLKTTLVDLHTNPAVPLQAQLGPVVSQSLFDGPESQQVILPDGQRLVPRLVRHVTSDSDRGNSREETAERETHKEASDNSSSLFTSGRQEQGGNFTLSPCSLKSPPLLAAPSSESEEAKRESSKSKKEREVLSLVPADRVPFLLPSQVEVRVIALGLPRRLTGLSLLPPLHHMKGPGAPAAPSATGFFGVVSRVPDLRGEGEGGITEGQRVIGVALRTQIGRFWVVDKLSILPLDLREEGEGGGTDEFEQLGVLHPSDRADVRRQAAAAGWCLPLAVASHVGVKFLSPLVKLHSEGIVVVMGQLGDVEASLCILAKAMGFRVMLVRGRADKGRVGAGTHRSASSAGVLEKEASSFADAVFGDEETLALETEVMAATGGLGASALVVVSDVKLARPMMRKAQSLLAPSGITVEVAGTSVGFPVEEVTRYAGLGITPSKLGERFAPSSVFSLLSPQHSGTAFFRVDVPLETAQRPGLWVESIREAAKRGLLSKASSEPQKTHKLNFFSADVYTPMEVSKEILHSVVEHPERGPVALSFGSGSGPIATRAPAISASPDAVSPPPVLDPSLRSLREDRTYIVVGGARGFGLYVAKWLACRGARYVMVSSRSPISPAEMVELRRLEQSCPGVSRFVFHAADASDKQSMMRMMARCCRVKPKYAAAVLAESQAGGRSGETGRDAEEAIAAPDLPPVAGVIMSAMVLQDQDFLNLQMEKARKVLAPKVQATLLLSEILSNSEDAFLDFCVFFSSVTSVLGNQRQAAYGAANSWMDTLAHAANKRFLQYHRHNKRAGREEEESRPVLGRVLSCNWGPISGAGVLTRGANSRNVAYLKSIGFDLVPAIECVHTLEALLPCSAVAQTMVGHYDWERIQKSFPQMRGVLEELLAETQREDAEGNVEGGGNQGTPRQRLDAAKTPADRLAVVCEYLGVLLNLEGKELDVQRSLGELGVDSLTKAMLPPRIERDLGAEVPPSLFTRTDATIVLCAEAILRNLESQGSKGGTGGRQLPDGIFLMREAPCERAALFCMSPAHRPVFALENLAAAFAKQDSVSFFGVGTSNPFEVVEPWSSVESLAEEYAAKIHSVQKEGPLFLAGYSYGGTVAFHVACVLEKTYGRGNDVRMLSLMDTFPNVGIAYEHARELCRQLMMPLADRQVNMLSYVMVRGLAVDKLRMDVAEYDQILEKHPNGELALKRLRGALASEAVRQGRAALLPDVEGFLRSVRSDTMSAFRTHLDYRPGSHRVKCPVTYIKAADPSYSFSLALLDSPQWTWGSLSANRTMPMDLYFTPGHHYNMLDSERAKFCAEILLSGIALRIPLPAPRNSASLLPRSSTFVALTEKSKETAPEFDLDLWTHRMRMKNSEPPSAAGTGEDTHSENTGTNTHSVGDVAQLTGLFPSPELRKPLAVSLLQTGVAVSLLSSKPGLRRAHRGILSVVPAGALKKPSGAQARFEWGVCGLFFVEERSLQVLEALDGGKGGGAAVTSAPHAHAHHVQRRNPPAGGGRRTSKWIPRNGCQTIVSGEISVGSLPSSSLSSQVKALGGGGGERVCTIVLARRDYHFVPLRREVSGADMAGALNALLQCTSEQLWNLHLAGSL